MTFIDWSDAQGMFGLLIDFVADERMECPRDAERCRFLEDLLTQLGALEARLPQIPLSVAIRKLRDLRKSEIPEFAGDRVMLHLQDCIEALERVANRDTRQPLM